MNTCEDNLLTHQLVLPQAVQPIYDLYAVANHGGGSARGHYWAHCKVDGSWRCFNDDAVRPINATEEAIDITQVVTPAAYLLFYKRREQLPPLL